MKQLLESCERKLVYLDVPVRSLTDAVGFLLDDLQQKGHVTARDRSQIVAEIQRKEKLSTSTIGHSLAVPHCYLDCLEKPIVAIARLKHGVNEGAPDGLPIRFVYLLLGPTRVAAEHLDTLANIARLMSDDEFRHQAGTAQNTDEFRKAIELRMIGETVALRHADVGEGLRYTGRLFGGFRADLQRRLPVYASDFKDGLHAKCVGATLFLFFACLAPAIIFGGLMHVLHFRRIIP